MKEGKRESELKTSLVDGQRMVSSCSRLDQTIQTGSGQLAVHFFASLGQFLCADRVRVGLSTFAQGRRRVDVDLWCPTAAGSIFCSEPREEADLHSWLAIFVSAIFSGVGVEIENGD